MTLERGNSGMSPAVASVGMNWPWGWAVGGGAAAGAINLLLNLSPNVLAAIPGAVGVGVFFFALVGGARMFLSRKGDRRARRYIANNPWQAAMVPAGLGAAGIALMTFIGSALSGALVGGLFLAILSGVSGGAVLWLILGVIAMVAGNREK